MWNIGGQRNWQRNNVRTSEESTTNIQESVQSLINEMQSQSQQSKGTQQQATTSLGSESLVQLQSLIGQLSAQATGDSYSKIRDATVKSIMDQGMNAVVASGTNSGAYDSTVTGQAGAQLTSRAANEGASAQAQAQQGLLAQISNLLGIEKGAQTQQNTQTEELMNALSQLFGNNQTNTNRTETTKTTGAQHERSRQRMFGASYGAKGQ